MMSKYSMLTPIGSGNFSTVHTAQDISSGQLVAIKIMRSHQNIALKEATMLKSFSHPNIVKLFEYQQDKEQTRMVLQYVPQSTLQLYEGQKYGLTQEQVRCILFQSALGLAYIHSRGIIHRDIKPQNILISKQSAEIKLIDFGLAVQTTKIDTDYVATRWYRAPENLLGTKEYTTAIDVFSLACVAVELYLGAPLFPGVDNVDQLYKIFNVFGEPSEQSWPLGVKKCRQLGLKREKRELIGLSNVLKSCSLDFVSLIEKMLILDPSKRITSAQILQHRYFKDIYAIIPPHIYKQFLKDHGKGDGEGKPNEVRKSVKKEGAEEKMQAVPMRQEVTRRSVNMFEVSLKENQFKQSKPKESEAKGGLVFRGFNQIKTNKVLPPFVFRHNETSKDSRTNSKDLKQSFFKNVSNNNQFSRRMINNKLQPPPVVGRRTSNFRDFHTLDQKALSIDKFKPYPVCMEGVKAPFGKVKPINFLPLNQSVFVDQLRSQRIMQNDSGRMLRNNSELNAPAHRKTVGQFKPSFLWPKEPNLQREKDKGSLSPGGMNAVQGQRQVFRHFPQENKKESIYTASFNRPVQKMKVIASPANIRQKKRSFEGEIANLSFLQKGRMMTTVEERSEWKPIPASVRPSMQEGARPSMQTSPVPFFRTRQHIEQQPQRKMASPEEKVKLVRSLQPIERENIKFPNFPTVMRREGAQVPFPVDGRAVRGENLLVKNLSGYLDGRGQRDRNISINVNLSFMDEQKVHCGRM